jgi:hypothetical protein
MTDSADRRRSGYRFPLTVLFALVTAVVTSVSTRLAADVTEWWRVDGIRCVAITAVMLILSSVLITALPVRRRSSGSGQYRSPTRRLGLGKR